MDLFILFLAFLAGGLSQYLMFGGVRSGPFEENIMANLHAGKRVIVSIDDKCFIFELNGNRMTVTKGISTYLEEPYDDSLDNSNSDKSINDHQISS